MIVVGPAQGQSDSSPHGSRRLCSGARHGDHPTVSLWGRGAAHWPEQFVRLARKAGGRELH